MTVQLTRRSAEARLMSKTLSEEIIRDLPLAWWHGNNFNDGQIGVPLADFTAHALDLKLWNDGAGGAGYPAKTGRLTLDPGDQWAQQMHPGASFIDQSAWPQLNFSGDFTLEAWIQPGALDLSGATWRDLIVKGAPGGTENSIQYGLRIAYVAPSYKLRAYVARSDGVQTTTMAAALVAGQVHHVCVTYTTTTNTILALWFDGAQIATAILNPLAPTPGAGSFVLGQFDQPANGYGGILDEICVYNKALAGQRIAAHYHAGIGS